MPRIFWGEALLVSFVALSLALRRQEIGLVHYTHASSTELLQDAVVRDCLAD
jgi:hypothetical protein